MRAIWVNSRSNANAQTSPIHGPGLPVAPFPKRPLRAGLQGAFLAPVLCCLREKLPEIVRTNCRLKVATWRPGRCT
jgi:hypothetical protein